MFQIVVFIIGILLSLSGIFYSFYEKYKGDISGTKTPDKIQVDNSGKNIIRFK